MQIIQNIREKGAAVVIVVIALSLIGFILMDARSGNNSLFGGGNTNVLGKVNGDKIEAMDFNKRFKSAEEEEAARTGQNPTGARTYALRDQVWNQMVAEKIFNKEAEKLGISLTPKELSAILLSNDPINPLTREQSMMDPTTNKLDMAKAQEALSRIKGFKGEDRERVNRQVVDPVRLGSAVAKYSGLINASAYYPAWMAEKENADANNYATISYTAIPYQAISDSSIKITDEDINAYVAKNKELFKQEAGRKISFLTVSQDPSKADSAAVFAEVEQLKQAFIADTNAAIFVARNGSIAEYRDAFLPKAKLQTTIADTLAKQAVGSVYGPYVEQGAYVMAKMLGSKMMPDSVGARHILITTADQQGNPIRTDEQAKKLADSLLAVVKTGGNFAALAAQYSADGSKDKGGDLGTFGYGQMVPEFNDYVFENSVGSTGVVKTQFGYHVINVTKQNAMKPAYKIAFMAKEIAPSDATINAASLAATKASAEKDRKSLQDYASKQGYALIENPAILKENDYAVGAMQDARQVVKWAFEAKPGQISEPFNIGNQFVVAVLDKKYEKGTMDAATARQGAEALVRNKKKAAVIKSKIGANPTLESAAQAYNVQVAQAGADSSITMASNMINGIGMEPLVIGASFDKTYQSKVSPAIEGNSGVYLIKVNSYGTKGVPPQDAAQRINNMRSQIGGWYEGLNKTADIKDSRSKMF